MVIVVDVVVNIVVVNIIVIDVVNVVVAVDVNDIFGIILTIIAIQWLPALYRDTMTDRPLKLWHNEGTFQRKDKSSSDISFKGRLLFSIMSPLLDGIQITARSSS